MATSVDDLKTSRSMSGKFYPDFETLHARIATALKKIIPNSNFKKKVYCKKKAHNADRLLHGRQIAFMIYEHFWMTGTHETILDFFDCMGEI